MAVGQAEDQPAAAEQPSDDAPVTNPDEPDAPADPSPDTAQPDTAQPDTAQPDTAQSVEEQPADVPATDPQSAPADGEGAVPDAPQEPQEPDAVDPAADPDAAATDGMEETQEAVPATQEPQAESAPAPEAAELSRPGPHPLVLLGVVVALFVLPIWIGNVLAKRFRMPDHGWRISLALGTISAATVVVVLAVMYNQFRGGPDLVGGITLIYEVEDPEQLKAGPETQDGGFQVADDDLDMDTLIGALTRRINPAGTKEITIREYGGAQVEIIVPKAGADELRQLKETITNLGELEFRIVANRQDPDHREIIRQAEETLSQYEKELTEDGERIAMWVPYDVAEFGPVDGPDPASPGRDMPKRPGKDRRDNDVPETLVLIDRFNVTGNMLDTTWADTDQQGRPAVSFRLDAEGATRFGQLTGRNLPNQTTGQKKFLGILLNRTLLSAPSIDSRITDQGIIQGDFTPEEVESLVNILNAGRLPAALNPTPLSEKVISPTLGAATVRQGAIAIVVSMALVLLFMLVYYRFAGLVACFALISNLMLVLGMMVLLKADFTLPGLAGLVLTIGMSVDANVLIFERIREELARGAAFRMAIRNGFEKAKSAIYDANVTTLLTGVVLFWIGTDEIKGFATTLIIGILMSVYTAVFCSRIIFDVAERRNWVSNVKMMQIVGGTNIDFLGMRYPAIAGSLVLIVVGLVAVVERGRDMLNIDFTGGVSASMVLTEDSDLTQGDVRAALDETELGDRNLLVVEESEIDIAEEADPRRFMVYVRVGAEEITQTRPDGTPMTEVEYVQNILKETFGDQLQTYSVGISDLLLIDETAPEAFVGGTEARIIFDEDEAVSFSALEEQLQRVLPEEVDGQDVIFSLDAEGYAVGSAERLSEWNIRINLPPDAARPLLEEFESQMDASPVFPMANVIGGQVAADMQQLAALAVFFSLLCIIGYIWLRFQQVMFGLAAVLAVVHDVLVTIGLLAISAWLVNYVYPLASILQLEPFQISLQVVAALLTIIGYSLNDTIVIFDRIREVRGKSPNLTKEMINTSVNQTLSRTLLTSFTTFIVVAILYFFGGAGIHAFAFSLVVGVIAGTYSTVFIASPALLWMSKPAQD